MKLYFDKNNDNEQEIKRLEYRIEKLEAEWDERPTIGYYLVDEEDKCIWIPESRTRKKTLFTSYSNLDVTITQKKY